MAFSNSSIKAPVKGKPHICLREGFWRVSPWDRSGLGGWHAAHKFAHVLNERRRAAAHYARKKWGALVGGN